MPFLGSSVLQEKELLNFCLKKRKEKGKKMFSFLLKVRFKKLWWFGLYSVYVCHHKNFRLCLDVRLWVTHGISALVWCLAAAFRRLCSLCLPALCFPFKEMMQGMNWVRYIRESWGWESLGIKNSLHFLNFEIQSNNLTMHKMWSSLRLNRKLQINTANNEKFWGCASPNHLDEVRCVFLMDINGLEVFKSLAFGNHSL